MIGTGQYMKREEKYPLLLVYLDDPEYERYPRSHRITTGAAAVITTWPAHVTTCWSIALIFTMSVLVFGFFGLTLQMAPIITPPKSACQPTPHLHLYLVHTSPNWTSQETRKLDILLQHYSKYNSTVVWIQNCTKPEPRLIRIKRTFKRIGNITILLRSPRKLTSDQKFANVMNKHPKTRVEITNCSQFFNHTILQPCLNSLSPTLINFAARALVLFQNGGLSFDLNSQLLNFTTWSISRNQIIDSSGVHSNLMFFPNIDEIPSDATSLDVSGHFMATKIPCHAFFQDVVTKVGTNCSRTLQVKDLVTETLVNFCKRGDIQSQYCKRYFKAKAHISVNKVI